MKVVAVVVTYNRKVLLEECLNAILSQTYEIDKIVLIDNNSTDGTYNYLESKGLIANKKITYVKLDKNIGGAGGFYEGMKKSQDFKPDWLWIMDDDTIPTIICLEELIKSLNIIKDKKIGMLASSIYGKNGESMNVPSVNIEASDSGYPDWYDYLADGIVKIKQATFVSLLINNDAVMKIGYPIKYYFIWGDDTEYTLRLNKFYGNSYFVGKSVAIHKRKIARQLSIFEETNVTRIGFYYYMIRNNLLNKLEYSGFCDSLLFFLKWQLKSILVLLKVNTKCKIKKFLIIHKALLSVMLHCYDKKAFKNRLDINVQYKK